MEDESEFDPLLMCGHRYASQLLTEEDMDDEYFVDVVFGPNYRDVIWAEENLTIVDLIKKFAKMRTTLYLSLEEKPSNPT
jgi:hypothetical protein